MLDDHGFEIYEENAFPQAYLLTFRTFGTWLHGSKKGSFQRSRDDRLKIIRVDSNLPLSESMRVEMNQTPVKLDTRQRLLVDEAIREVCAYRGYRLDALNVRSNHTHGVVAKPAAPEKIMNDFKAYSTRRLRSEGAMPEGDKVWSRGGSTRYLWKPRHVDAAIEYVMYSQGDVPFAVDADSSEW